MNKIPFSRKKAEESSINYWNQINDFLALSEAEDLSGDALALHYLYWIFSETVNGTFIQYFENKQDWDQDQVLTCLKELGNKKYSEHFEKAKILFEKVTELSVDFDKNEDRICDLENEMFDLGIIYQDKPDALDFIESVIRNDEEKYLSFLD
jgi:hypothetical protein